MVRRQPIAWHLFDVTVLEPIEQTFHVVRLGRRWLGMPIRAINVDKGQVSASAFFTPHDIASMSPEAVRWGPTQPHDVAQPPFAITKLKDEGRTPGFFVTDARGGRYLIKLDPVEAPELLSGAEVISSKLLYALGYHVPSYEVVRVQPQEAHIEPGLMHRDAGGVAHPFTEEALAELLTPRVQDGTVRMVASRILEGEILGPARFKHFRACADIRALKVAYAWLNNIDAKDHNSLLVWDGQRTVGYLIDFGTSLGADAGRAGPKHPCEGWQYVVDLKEWSWDLLTLGRHQSGCDPREQPLDQAIGLLSPRVDPERWKPYAPNVAFNEMNDEDAEWMARRMAQLSRAQIGAAVSAGQYSQAEDAAYLTDVLEQRRTAIVDHYLD